MFSNPAETGFFGNWFFKNRRAINKDAVPVWTDSGFNFVGQFLQPSPQHFVIIAAQGVAGYVGFALMVQQFFRGILIFHQVVHAHGNNANRSGHQLLWSAALAPMARHIAHLAVIFLFEPGVQAVFGLRQIDVTDSQLLKAQLLAPGADVIDEFLLFQRCNFTFPRQGNVVVVMPV